MYEEEEEQEYKTAKTTDSNITLQKSQQQQKTANSFKTPSQHATGTKHQLTEGKQNKEIRIHNQHYRQLLGNTGKLVTLKTHIYTYKGIMLLCQAM